METINELYKIYFNYNILPSKAPELWHKFNEGLEKAYPKNLKLEIPLYIKICDRYKNEEKD